MLRSDNVSWFSPPPTDIPAYIKAGGQTTEETATKIFDQFAPALTKINWAGSTEEDVDPIIVYGADGERTTLEVYGGARVREVKFRGLRVVSAAMVYDDRPKVHPSLKSTLLKLFLPRDLAFSSALAHHVLTRQPESQGQAARAHRVASKLHVFVSYSSEFGGEYVPEAWRLDSRAEISHSGISASQGASYQNSH
ncbi:hypothetical protein C8R44DRAFT_975128 [Mycena epipterygia]|nr:hypothetical protein C8R44DRAFT_975128 [Mycena epipterygia]